MTLYTIDGHQFSQMVLMGARHLANHAKKIDALNVFPVPDGDTGTNMNLSISTGAKEVKAVNSDHAAEVADAFAKGLLMGARGNSGVILSQLFRGFAIGFAEKKKVTTKDFAQALYEGVNTAYKAVMKPVEGTMLTVAKDAANRALHVAEKEEDMIALMEEILDEAKQSLERTPDLLPVLKEVGVVDSGGKGLVVIYEGFLHALKGEELLETEDDRTIETMIDEEHQKIAQDFMSADEITFGYCTEFIVKFEEDKTNKQPFNEADFRSELNQYGDSLLVVSDPEVVKVHIHTENPGDVLNLGQRYGSFISIDIENMREQHTKIVHGKNEPNIKEKAPYAIITFALGSGIKELLESLGSTYVIEGGQTMNPSTQEITDAIEQVHAEKVIILPNNKNIIMAAEQAASMRDESVHVIKTTSIPEGISALIAFDEDNDLETNQQRMEQAIQEVKTGQVTYAVRDTTINGTVIEKGHFMGIANGEIKVTNKDRFETVQALLETFIQEDDELLTVLYGEDVSEDEVEKLQQFIEETYDDIEVEIYHGNQPIYSYIFSLE